MHFFFNDRSHAQVLAGFFFRELIVCLFVFTLAVYRGLFSSHAAQRVHALVEVFVLSKRLIELLFSGAHDVAYAHDRPCLEHFTHFD